jgi:uncharacterized protein YneF (UPF0154 family)
MLIKTFSLFLMAIMVVGALLFINYKNMTNNRLDGVSYCEQLIKDQYISEGISPSENAINDRYAECIKTKQTPKLFQFLLIN